MPWECVAGSKGFQGLFVLSTFGRITLSKLEDILASLGEGERASIMEMAQAYQDSVTREKGQVSFMEFVKVMWPGFIHGRHHAVMSYY